MVKATPRYYLAEWYRPEVTERLVDEVAAHLGLSVTAVSTADSPVRLLLTMVVPADEVLYCLFGADSPEKVVEVCQHAGMPPDRITSGVDARLPSQPRCNGSGRAGKREVSGRGEVVFADFGTGS